MFNFETGRLSEPLLFWFWKGYQFSEKIILIKALEVRGGLGQTSEILAKAII